MERVSIVYRTDTTEPLKCHLYFPEGIPVGMYYHFDTVHMAIARLWLSSEVQSQFYEMLKAAGAQKMELK